MPLDRRVPLFAMSQQQRNGEAEEHGNRRTTSTTSTTSTSASTSTDVLRTSKKALRSSISATLKALSDEEMARQSEFVVYYLQKGLKHSFISLLVLSLTSTPKTFSLSGLHYFYPTGAEIARFVLASPIWKRSKKVGVYLAAPRLREVDTELLVRAALGQETAAAENKTNGADGVFATSTSNSTNEGEKKRLFVPIVGDGPQEMCLVHLGESLFLKPASGRRRSSREKEKGRVLCLLALPLNSLFLSLSFLLPLFLPIPRFARRDQDRAPLRHKGAVERIRRWQAAGGL